MFNKFFDSTIKRDGRVGCYLEHFGAQFLMIAIAMVVITVIGWIIGTHTLVLVTLVAALLAVGSYRADKRINGATVNDNS